MRRLPAPAIGSNLPLMVGAVIYVRVSTKEQTENLSLPTQLRACEEYCRRQGYEILERFHEEAQSSRLSVAWFCALRRLRPSTDRQLSRSKAHSSTSWRFYSRRLATCAW
jgi:hypothetical protein